MNAKIPTLRLRSALLRLAILLILLPLQLPGATLNDGLIAFYPFTGNANDGSTNGNNGTVMGAQLTSDRNGVASQAYLFNGVDNYINIGNRVKPNFPLTVTAWIYPTSSDGEAHTIFRSGTFNNAGSYNGVLLTYSGQGLLFTFIGSGPYSSSANYRSRIMSNAGVIPANKWTHVVLVWIDYQTTKFYVNGVFQPSQPNGFGSGTTIVNTATDGAIGMQDNPSYPAPFMGKLDEVRVYNRELSASEVTSLAIEPPQVTVQPSSVTTNAGSTVVFTASATGAGPLNFLWQFQGTNISGVNTNTLTLTNVTVAHSGTYRVVVSNSAGTNFADATLTVPSQVVSAMPQLFTNNVPFTVTVSVAPPVGTFAYAVQDQVPTNWPVSQISNSGSFTGGKVKWIFSDGASRTLSYRITPPADAVGTNHFAGTASFNGTNNVAITGVRDCYNEVARLSLSTFTLLDDQYAKLTVTGKVGASYYILVADGLEQPNTWRTNATITLTESSQDWLDSELLGNSRRFYRLKASP